MSPSIFIISTKRVNLVLGLSKPINLQSTQGIWKYPTFESKSGKKMRTSSLHYINDIISASIGLGNLFG